MKMPHEKPASQFTREPHISTSSGPNATNIYVGRTLKFEAGLLAAGLIIAALLSSLAPLSSWLQKSNTLPLRDGAVRLGTVYREQLTSQLVVSRVIDNTELLRVETDPEHLHALAVERVLHSIRQINDQAKATQGSQFTPVKLDTAMWNDDIRVRLQTIIEYESEFQHPYRFTMDSSDRIIKKDQAAIKPLLDSIQNYGKGQLLRYRAEFSFIRPREAGM